MIKSIQFENYRNLDGRNYKFDNILNVIVGKNNSGKTNLLDGIKIAFSCINGDYCKISKGDFTNSDDNNIIIINVELNYNSIPSFNFIDESLTNICGFKVTIKKTQSGRYIKQLTLLNGSPVDLEIIREDKNIPNLYTIPLVRVEDIYADALSTGLSNFITSEQTYKKLICDSKSAVKEELKDKTKKFKDFCSKFDQNLDIELTNPKISNEKVYVVDGVNEHNTKIGSGYKSIANIILNTLDENYNIILIDEIENHLHPALIRTLIRELRDVKNTLIITTTHSSVVINELNIDEIIDISGVLLSSLKETCLNKLNTFLHPGRNELILADNIILVEGYTEEILLKNYLKKYNNNWTIINVSGVMFEPYIELSLLLNKRILVISDNDKALSDTQEKSQRFKNLEALCYSQNIKLLEMENTLESDLYKNNYLEKATDLLKQYEKNNNYFVAKEHKKTEIASFLIAANVDLSNWHIIKDINNEF